MDKTSRDFVDVAVPDGKLSVLCIYRCGDWGVTTAGVPQKVHLLGGPPAIEPDYPCSVTHLPSGLKATVCGDLYRAMLWADALAEAFADVDPMQNRSNREKHQEATQLVRSRLEAIESKLNEQNDRLSAEESGSGGGR